MFRIGAVPNSTQMVNNQSVGYFSDIQLIGIPMCVAFLPIYGKLPVAIFQDTPNPKPASLGFVHFIQESLFRVHLTYLL